jgi:iron(III) transport system substrate-binding protein
MVFSKRALRGRHSGRRLGAVATAGVVAAGVLAACGGGGSGPGGPGSITLYSGQHTQTTQALVAAFQRQTGIHVNERDGDETSLAQQIQQEGSSSPADVFYTENSPALMALQGKGLLVPAGASTLAAVPAKYSSPQGDWVAVSARISVLVYNTSRLNPSQLPTSILDLAKPQWKGKLALAPTETDFQPVVTSVAQAEGTSAALAWLKAVKGNASAHIEPSNETVTADVNSGQAAIGLVDHYYWYRMAKEVGASGVHSQIAYFAAQDPGYVVDVSGAAVLKSSKHQAAAQQFLAFLVSAAGQQVMVASDSFEYPLRPGVAAPVGLKPFAQLQPAPVTIEQLGDGSEALHLLQQAQLV